MRRPTRGDFSFSESTSAHRDAPRGHARANLETLWRHLFLPACICLVTLSGAAGADEISSEAVSAAKTEDIAAPAPVAGAPVGEFSDQAQLPVAADVPMPIKRALPMKDHVVARSRHEICTSVAESAHSHDLPLPFFISAPFSGKRFQAGCGEPRRRAGHCAIHAGDGGDRGA